MRFLLSLLLWSMSLGAFSQDSVPSFKHVSKIEYLHDLWNEGKTILNDQATSKNKKNHGDWKEMGCGGRGRVNQLLVHPQNDAMLFAVTPGGGIWRSSDTGNSWHSSFQDFPSISTNWVQFHPTVSGLVYAATGDWRFNVSGDGMYYSKNHGLTWQKKASPELSQPVNLLKFVFHPTRGNQMVAISNQRIYTSADTGSSWITVHTSACTDLIQLPAKPDVLFVTQAGKNVLRSADFGNTWTEIEIDPTVASNVSWRLSVSNQCPNSVFLYASNESLYKSTDGGRTFMKLGNADVNPSYFNMAILVHPKDSQMIFVGGIGFGFFHTTNGFTGLLNINGNYNGVDYHHFSMAANGTCYLTNDNGIHKSSDGGYTWRKLTYDFNNQEVYSFSLSHVSKSCIMGTQDGGSKWISDTCLHVGPNDGGSGILFPGTDQLAFSTDQTKRAYRIENFKTNYTQPYANLPGNFPYIFSVHPDRFGTLMTVSPKELQISRDTAKSWQIIKSGLGTAIALTYHPLYSNRIFAAYNQQIDVSDNEGLTWTKFSNAPDPAYSIRKMAIHPADSQIVWLLARNYQTQQHRVFVTRNGGKIWDTIHPPNSHETFTDLAMHPRGDVFVSSLNRVIRYQPETGLWEDFSHGLSRARITQLTVDVLNNRVLVSTYGRGMWESPLDAVDPVSIEPGVKNPFHIYPNPATASFQINGLQREAQFVIYDFSGRKILAGKSTGIVELHGIQSGCYIVQITENESVQTLKLVVRQP